MKIFTTISAFIALTFTSSANATEQLEYSVIEKDNKIEVREYESYVTASVSYKTKAEYDRKAFRTLFGYISGNNTSSQDIDMTAPVIIDDSTKIPMTAPVLINQDGGEKKFEMAFVLPAIYSYNNAPRPLSSEVTLTEVAKKMKATIRFSGFMSDRNAKKNTTALLSWLKNDGRFNIVSKPMLAGYNAPMTPPFMRRNEIMIEVELK